MQFLTKPSHRFLIVVAVLVITATMFGVQRFGHLPLQHRQSEVPTIQEIVAADLSQSPSDVSFSNPVLLETAAATLVQPQETEMPATEPTPTVIAILEEIKTLIEQQNDAFLYFDDRLEPFTNLVPELESAISLQSSVAELMERRMSNLETQVSDLAEIFTDIDTATSEDTNSKPPFRLIAIDRWNNEWNAVIQLDGKISMIGPQASRVGWLLVEIDPNEQTALFRTASGEEVKLEISG